MELFPARQLHVNIVQSVIVANGKWQIGVDSGDFSDSFYNNNQFFYYNIVTQ